MSVTRIGSVFPASGTSHTLRKAPFLPVKLRLKQMFLKPRKTRDPRPDHLLSVLYLTTDDLRSGEP